MLKRRYFSMNFFFYDRCGIRSRLESLAQRGWLLESADYLGWRFTRSEPKPVRYAVTYFAKQDRYTGEHDEDIREFNAMCAEGGWNYVASRSNLRIYRSESENPTPMDTDPIVELATIHRAAKRSFLRSHWIYFTLSLLILVLAAWLFVLDPIELLADNRTLLSCVIFPVALVISGVELVSYYRWRSRALKYAEATGEFLPARSHPVFVRVTLTLIILVYIAHLLLEGISRDNVETLFRLAIILIAGIVAYIASEHFKAKGASAGENRGSTVAIVIIAVIVMQIVSSVITDRNSFENFFPEPVPENYGSGYNFDTPLPLELEDLGLGKYSDEGYFETMSSVFLSYTVYYDQPFNYAGQSMAYIILDVRADFLYDFLYSSFYSPFFGSPYTRVEEDAELWHADAVWNVTQLHPQTTIYNICIDNRMIVINFTPTVDLTDEQKSLIGERLSPVNCPR